MTDIALAALAVLVREHDLTRGAVIDQGLIAEHESLLKELQEDPLRPLVVIVAGGVDDTRPVKREADAL